MHVTEACGAATCIAARPRSLSKYPLVQTVMNTFFSLTVVYSTAPALCGHNDEGVLRFSMRVHQL